MDSSAIEGGVGNGIAADDGGLRVIVGGRSHDGGGGGKKAQEGPEAGASDGHTAESRRSQRAAMLDIRGWWYAANF